MTILSYTVALLLINCLTVAYKLFDCCVVLLLAGGSQASYLVPCFLSELLQQV